MRFHSPLDDEQWHAAVRQHSQMRDHLHRLKESYPPRTRQQRLTLRAYRATIQDFARELVRPRDMIDPERLNELQEEASNVYVRYMVDRMR